MGDQRDYGNEYQDQKDFSSFKFEGGSEALKEKPPRWSGRPKIPADENYYQFGTVTKIAEEILNRPYPSGESAPTYQYLDSLKTQNLPQSPPPQKKQGFWGKLFNKQNQQPPSHQLQGRSTPQNKQNQDKNPYSAPRSVNLRRSQQDTPAVENFKQQVKNRAHGKLEQNSIRAEQLRFDHVEGSNSATKLTQLRDVVRQDGELEAEEHRIRTYLEVYTDNEAIAQVSDRAYDPEKVAQLNTRLETIKLQRATLAQINPTSALVKTSEANLNDDKLKAIINKRFAGVQKDIETAQEKILNNDVSPTKLEPVIQEVLKQISPNTSFESLQQINDYLQKTRNAERRFDIARNLGGGAISIAAIASWWTGAPALLTGILGGFGAVIEGGNAVYDFEQARDLHDLAKAGMGAVGGDDIIANSDEAKQRYYLALGNLLLAGIDGGLSISEGLSYTKKAQSILSQIDEATLARVSSHLEDLPSVKKGKYLEIVASNSQKGEALLEFKNFGSPERFRNVMNALDSVEDVGRLKRVFDEDYLNSLGETMANRYRKLLDDVANGNPPSAPEYVGDLSFSERLKVLDEVERIKTELAQKTKKAPADVLEIMRVTERNIGYGSYEIKLPNGEIIEGKFVSTSGKTSSSSPGADLLDYTGETLSDGKTVIPDFPKKKKSKFFEANESMRANDSERKAFEYIMGQIKFKSKKLRINFKPGGNYEGQGLSGKITINSEMTPCDSCEDVITKQFENYFGDDIAVEVKYGVEFKNR